LVWIVVHYQLLPGKDKYGHGYYTFVYQHLMSDGIYSTSFF
jgi:hypothetical protein